MTLTGPVNGGVSSVGIDLVAGKTLTNSSTITGQLVSLTSDLDSLAGGTIAGGTGIVALKPTTPGLGITLGGSSAGCCRSRTRI